MEDAILDFTTNLAILHRQFQRAMNQILEADEMPQPAVTICVS